MAIKSSTLEDRINTFTADLLQGKEQWIPFLDTASYMYKYRFPNQVAIYLQKENATACTSLAQWNRMGRDIIKYHPGIRLAELDRFNEYIYVWDISDTKSRDAANEIKLWSIPDAAKQRVKEYLEKTHELPESEDYRFQLKHAAKDVAGDLFLDMAEALIDDNEDDADPVFADDIEILSTICENSAEYIVCLRCGIKPEMKEEDFPFSKLSERAGRLNYIERVGRCIALASQEVLYGIEKEVKSHLEEIQGREYNLDKEKIREEKSRGRETELQEGRGTAASGLRGGSTAAAGTDRQIRETSAGVFDGRKTAAIHPAEPEGNAEGASDGEGAGSGRNAADVDRENEEEPWDDRRNERSESDFMGPGDERNSDGSGQDRFAGGNIQLNFLSGLQPDKEKPQEENENKYAESAESRVDDTLFFYAEVLPAVLRNAVDYQNWLDGLCRNLSSEDEQERKKSILYTYKGTYCGIQSDKGESYAAIGDERGITIARGRKVSENPSAVTYSWDEVEKKILETLQDGSLYIDTETERFITEDDMNRVFMNGSNAGHILRVKEFFQNEKNNKQRAAFLKEEFGIGGNGGPGYCSGSWDAKGIRFSRQSCPEIRFSWSMAAKRMAELLEKGKAAFLDEMAEQDELKQPEVRKIEEDGSSKIDFKDDENETPIGNTIEVSEVTDKTTQTVASMYTITNMDLGVGLKSEKYSANMDAIRLLHKLEEEGRAANEDEQNILARYVGWGGLSDVFEESNSRYQKTKETLSETEYRAARASVLNAHYTAPLIIQKMYDILDNLEFEGGKILEPAMGIGNFFGMMPEKLRENSKLYGVELDSVSGRIAKQLYPGADIQVKGYEETAFADNSMDVVIGNVPFGQYSINDKAYNRHGFRIHDYFFAKSIDKVKAGGLILFITSRYTMDKKSSKVREYIAQRADLLGAIRLPNTAFKANAGTEVTSDILILQKKDVPEVVDESLSWLNLGVDENGLVYNQYFIDHPEMVVGQIEEISGPYGPEITCSLDDHADFESLLTEAVRSVHGKFQTISFFNEFEEAGEAIPATEDAPDYSYSLVDGKLYYREGAKMQPANLGKLAAERATGMIAVRECVREVIDLQVNDAANEEILDGQKKLQDVYQRFTEKYGLISSKANEMAFRDDAGYPLISSLEQVDDDGNLIRLADIFTKRTVRKAVAVSTVSSAAEALAVCLDQRGRVDPDYMASIAEMEKEKLISNLSGVIFRIPDIEHPESREYVTADEYLSGNVRSKLVIAKVMAANDPEFQINVTRLESVIPEWVDASKIDARLGSVWIPPDVYEQFVIELLELPGYARKDLHVAYSELTGTWLLPNKSLQRWSSLVTTTYGTDRANAYRLIENTLNMKTVQITDTVIDADGTQHVVVNQEETAKACQKQDMIKQKFKEWIWQDIDRRKRLEEIYNIRFNSNVTREYDGSHLTYPGMNPEITLRPHQNRAVARQLYGGNTLLAHAVGAGKTYEMIAAIMEKKRLGLCSKAMLVVPNHLTGQWAKEYMTLYPTAKILAVTKKDFTPANRRRFCSRIATGDYDAVIIGHSQFEMIPLSVKRQREFIEAQLDDVKAEIEVQRAEQNQSFTVKQLERMAKNLRTKLQKLNEGSRKDHTITFEQLGIDHLGVDEAHNYKNLALVTKMTNVAGISTTGANKSYDMFAKCRYIDELTHGKGITFATGTPISNSMTELYTMQKYLQYDQLQDMGLITFDAWASTFGETVTSWELAPEGTKYRQRTRFAKFFNLPELMSVFKNAADIQMSDQLQLDVPDAVKENVVVKPTMRQLELIREIGERADVIHDGNIDSTEDNMLKVTTDGRKLALDERILTGEKEHPLGQTKADICVENCLRIYQETIEKRSAQLIFCDLSTPKNDGSFTVYEELKRGLMEGGVLEKEIAFIHDAGTEAKKEELFANVRKGKVRFLIGSTQKMGAGMNVQDRLIALHHLDVPWRPADIEQQEGRIIRQGNQNDQVYIYRYLTENTFDAYSWQTLEIKQRFISQIMTSKNPARSCEDIDETSMDYAGVKAICTGDPTIKEKMELENDVKQLKMMREAWQSDQFRFQELLYKKLPRDFKENNEKLELLKKDAVRYKEEKDKPFAVNISGISFTDKSEAGNALYQLTVNYKESETWVPIGTFRTFGIEVNFYDGRYRMRLCGEGKYVFDRGANPKLIAEKMEEGLNGLNDMVQEYAEKVQQISSEMVRIENELAKPFFREEEFREKEQRLAELDAAILTEKEQPKEDERFAYTCGIAYIALTYSKKDSLYLVFDSDFDQVGRGVVVTGKLVPADIAELAAEEYGLDPKKLQNIPWEDYENKMQSVLLAREEEHLREYTRHEIAEEEID